MRQLQRLVAPLVLVLLGTACTGASHPRGAATTTPASPAGQAGPDTISVEIAAGAAARPQIAALLRHRLAAARLPPDVSAATTSDTVTLRIPRAAEDTLPWLTAPAHLTFRQVRQQAATLPSPASRQPVTPPAGSGPASPDAATTAAFAAATCPPRPPRLDRPTAWIVACDVANRTKYLLAPAQVGDTDLMQATATADTGWTVMVSFTSHGQQKFTALTEHAIGQQVAIVVDGIVQSAPTIQDRITGDVQISGDLNEQQANELAAAANLAAAQTPLSIRSLVKPAPTPTTLHK